MLDVLLDAVDAVFDLDIFLGRIHDRPYPARVLSVIQIDRNPHLAFFGGGGSVEEALVESLLRIIKQQAIPQPLLQERPSLLIPVCRRYQIFPLSGFHLKIRFTGMVREIYFCDSWCETSIECPVGEKLSEFLSVFLQNQLDESLRGYHK